MEFWKWYLKGIVHYLNPLRMDSALQIALEDVLGTVVIMMSAIFLGTLANPFFFLILLLTPLPTAHAIWREEHRK